MYMYMYVYVHCVCIYAIYMYIVCTMYMYTCVYTQCTYMYCMCKCSMCAKNRGNKKIPLAILSRILAQSCVTPPDRQRVMHDCASILDSIAKGISIE